VAVYSVVTKPPAAKSLDQIDRRADRERITSRIESLAKNPRPFGSKKLQGLQNTYRVREGDYRIVYDIDDSAETVVVLKIKNRKDVYRRGRA
jgi:mRNA interferase RelE/StbE